MMIEDLKVQKGGVEVDIEIQKIQEKVEKEGGFCGRLTDEIAKVIVGQNYMIDRLLIGLLADGHILLEGVPGLAKTMAVRTLSKTIKAGFKRIQFTPDLLPADLTGTMVFNPKTGDFLAKKGPLFTNVILADEINRAPAKVQSALLEAMQERQVTIGDTTFNLDYPFMVLATQNPIEQEGTYPLPEAQVDRFMLKLNVTYPDRNEEEEIIERMTKSSIPEPSPVIGPADIKRARDVVTSIYVDKKVKNYVLDIVFATRNPSSFDLPDLKNLIQYGSSPRASIYLTVAAKAHAFLRRRGYVTPEDVKAIAMDVLRHRIIVTYEAEAEEVTSEQIVQKILDKIEVP
jgi:MoxR-like ATPase